MFFIAKPNINEKYFVNLDYTKAKAYSESKI